MPLAVSPYRIDTRVTEDGIAVLSLSGSLEDLTAAEFRRSLLSLADRGHRDVVMDFTETSFVGSSALGALIEAARRVRGDGGDIYLTSPSPLFRRMLEITRLIRIFPVLGTAEDALEKVRRRRLSP